MINLFHGDCLEKMKDIPDKSIDMVLADPPYGTTSCKWDSVVPFAPMWEQLKRITKDNGAICLFGSEPFSSHLRLSNLKMFKYDWILEKSQGIDFQLAKKRPMKKHEICSVFALRSNYYPQGLIPCHMERGGSKNGKTGFVRINPKTEKNHIRTFSNYPTSIIPFNKIKNEFHPTQKPVDLLEYLIKTYTLENETVLDFTMGSGSTGVACKNLNRNFIGIEKDDKYFKIAKNRING